MCLQQHQCEQWFQLKIGGLGIEQSPHTIFAAEDSVHNNSPELSLVASHARHLPSHVAVKMVAPAEQKKNYIVHSTTKKDFF